MQSLREKLLSEIENYPKISTGNVELDSLHAAAKELSDLLASCLKDETYYHNNMRALFQLYWKWRSCMTLAIQKTIQLKSL